MTVRSWLKTMVGAGLFALCLSGCSSAEPSLNPESMAAFVAQLDAIKVPIDPKLLKENDAEAVEGDLSLQMDDAVLSKLSGFQKGYKVTLVGSSKKPVAAVLWLDSTVRYHLIPFKGVTKLDRKRRLTKMGDRFYQVESNRSQLGVSTDTVDPS